MQLPRLYAIIDKETLDRHGVRVSCFAGEMARSGVSLVQFRDKRGTPQQVLQGATVVSRAFAETEAMLIMNDRPDLASLAGWRGVHVGHLDMSACAARKVMGAATATSFIGVSTHNDSQVAAAEEGCADYIAVGPVFATTSKTNAEPVIGLEGVRRLRKLTRKPIVAIGGITRENAQSVLDAGADCVAVIGGLFVRGERPGKVAEDFLELLR